MSAPPTRARTRYDRASPFERTRRERTRRTALLRSASSSCGLNEKGLMADACCCCCGGCCGAAAAVVVGGASLLAPWRAPAGSAGAGPAEVSMGVMVFWPGGFACVSGCFDSVSRLKEKETALRDNSNWRGSFVLLPPSLSRARFCALSERVVTDVRWWWCVRVCCVKVVSESSEGRTLGPLEGRRRRAARAPPPTASTAAPRAPERRGPAPTHMEARREGVLF